MNSCENTATLAQAVCSWNQQTTWVFEISPVFANLLIAERPWRRLKSNPVCFGAIDNQFGRFLVEVDGHIDALKLVHLHGKVSCDVSKSRWSNWGCGKEKLMLFLTNATDDVLIPKVEGAITYTKLRDIIQSPLRSYGKTSQIPFVSLLSKSCVCGTAWIWWTSMSSIIMAHPALMSLRCFCRHKTGPLRLRNCLLLCLTQCFFCKLICRFLDFLAIKYW